MQKGSTTINLFTSNKQQNKKETTVEDQPLVVIHTPFEDSKMEY